MVRGKWTDDEPHLARLYHFELFARISIGNVKAESGS